MQVALPGSGMPHPGELSKAFPGRMLRLSLVPDKGPVNQQWIPPETAAQRSDRLAPCEREMNAKHKIPVVPVGVHAGPTE